MAFDKKACQRRLIRNPKLKDYDAIVVSTSSGKDSISMLSYVMDIAKKQDVANRMMALHSDLGTAEWPGVKNLVQVQSKKLRVPFDITSRIGVPSKGGHKPPNPWPIFAKGDPWGTLLDYYYGRALQLAMSGREKVRPFPDMGNARNCTSEYKTHPIYDYFKFMAQRWVQSAKRGRPFRVLDAVGLRAEESPGRAKLVSFETKQKNQSKQRPYYCDGPWSPVKLDHDKWLPIFCWEEKEVYDYIRKRRLPMHRAYKLGMPRLSCVVCVFHNLPINVISAYYNPKVYKEFMELEESTGHKFLLGKTKPWLEEGWKEAQKLKRAGKKPPPAATYEGNCDIGGCPYAGGIPKRRRAR